MKKMAGCLVLLIGGWASATGSALAADDSEAAVSKVSAYMAASAAVARSRECWMETRLGERAIELKGQNRALEFVVSKVKDERLAAIVKDAYGSPLDKDEWASRHFQACTERILSELN